jgi:hypothetical protein
MSTLSVGTIRSNTSAPPVVQNTSGTQIGTFCRAWVNFNGTTNVGGFCTIRASFNVTSVADNGTGDYTVNFTTAMPDANYAVNGTGGFLVSTTPVIFLRDNLTAPTANAVRIGARLSSSLADNDVERISITIFR